MSAMQNAVALIPAAALAALTPFAVHDGVKAAIAVGGVLLDATLAVSLYVRAPSIPTARRRSRCCLPSFPRSPRCCRG